MRIGAGRKCESPLGPRHLREPSTSPPHLTACCSHSLARLAAPPRRLITSPRPSTLQVRLAGCIRSGAVTACTPCALVLSPLPPSPPLQARRPLLNQTAAPWRPPGSWTTCSRCRTCRGAHSSAAGRLWQQRRQFQLLCVPGGLFAALPSRFFACLSPPAAAPDAERHADSVPRAGAQPRRQPRGADGAGARPHAGDRQHVSQQAAAAAGWAPQPRSLSALVACSSIPAGGCPPAPSLPRPPFFVRLLLSPPPLAFPTHPTLRSTLATEYNGEVAHGVPQPVADRSEVAGEGAIGVNNNNYSRNEGQNVGCVTPRTALCFALTCFLAHPSACLPAWQA